MKQLFPILFSTALGAVALPAAAQEPGDHFVIRDLDTDPKAAVAALRDHVESHEDWLFLASFPLKGGEVQAMKICYLPIGADVFASGLRVAAMMPCGNLAFYEEDGQSRLSMLDLGYLADLQPDPNVERAVATAGPAFDEMLDTVFD